MVVAFFVAIFTVFGVTGVTVHVGQGAQESLESLQESKAAPAPERLLKCPLGFVVWPV